MNIYLDIETIPGQSPTVRDALFIGHIFDTMTAWAGVGNRVSLDKLCGIFTGGDMSETYTPANGTEGAAFFDCWCRRCARDKAMRDTLTGDLFA